MCIGVIGEDALVVPLTTKDGKAESLYGQYRVCIRGIKSKGGNYVFVQGGPLPKEPSYLKIGNLSTIWLQAALKVEGMQ